MSSSPATRRSTHAQQIVHQATSHGVPFRVLELQTSLLQPSNADAAEAQADDSSIHLLGPQFSRSRAKVFVDRCHRRGHDNLLPALDRWRVPRKKVTVIENWAPLAEIQVRPKDEPLGTRTRSRRRPGHPIRGHAWPEDRRHYSSSTKHSTYWLVSDTVLWLSTAGLQQAAGDEVALDGERRRRSPPSW